MRTITFSVADEAETKRRVRAAFERKKQGHHMSFASVELMWRSPNRRQIIQIMTGEEPMTLREIARRAERAVHDVQPISTRCWSAASSIAIRTGGFLFPTMRCTWNFTLKN